MLEANSSVYINLAVTLLHFVAGRGPAGLFPHIKGKTITQDCPPPPTSPRVEEDKGRINKRTMTTPTLHLSMVTRPGLMPGNGPLLEDWAIVFKKEWQTKVGGSGTSCIRTPIELGAIGRIVMGQHLYRTVWSCDL